METTFTANPIYSGEFRHAVDSKGRITVPARWRRAEAEDFYILPEQHGDFLIVMPPEEFQAIGRKVTADTSLSEDKKRKFFRTFYSQAQSVSVDRQGRMLLPEEYCRRVGIQEEVILAGGLVRFEVWNPDRWKAVLEAQQNDYCTVSDAIGL